FVRYAGPTLAGDAAYSWTVRVQDKEGGWSAPSSTGSFVTAPRDSDWTASWLQPAAASPLPDRVSYVRAEVELPAGRLRRATAFLAGAHTAQLFVNGQRLSLGPSFSYPDEQYFCCVDVTGSVR